jgi:hypothetical protein
MKLIVLQAFGGLLTSQPIHVQEYTPDYRVPYRIDKPSYKPVADLSQITNVTIMRTARFVRADRFLVLDNKNSALIYELEQM